MSHNHNHTGMSMAKVMAIGVVVGAAGCMVGQSMMNTRKSRFKKTAGKALRTMEDIVENVSQYF